MTLRHCAAEGCSGTLPVGKGKHCPRCGGTAFLVPRRRGRRGVLILLAMLGLAMAVILLFAKRQSAMTAVEQTAAARLARTDLPSTATGERPALMAAHDVATQMTQINNRDDAYAQILHRALTQHDFEYACQLGDEMTQLDTKDKSLLEVVEEALKAHQPEWANRAANEMIEISVRDEAFKKIMDSMSAK